MIINATDVGELVVSLPSRQSEGRVSRVFRNSAYIEAGDELLLLLHGELRSPINVNLNPSENLEELLAVEDSCSLVDGGIVFGELTVKTKGAKVYRSGLGASWSGSPVAGSVLVKGIEMLRLLYGAAKSDLDIFSEGAFRQFAEDVISPLAGGHPDEAHALRYYLPLIGAGGGFTPAGDDFVGGFTAALNHVARTTGEAEILFSRSALTGRTVPESAALIHYAQRGYVDEELERLIVSTFGGRRERFFQDLLQVAKRGHTSGIDMSTGVLLAAAATRDRAAKEGALERCLRAVQTH
ncbi:MAG: DUF2877 domain-containing protein [Thaumarchaeota archaeon]|nr:DUF2877 domain-containing protein [Nitrososphaerota archaeon]